MGTSFSIVQDHIWWTNCVFWSAGWRFSFAGPLSEFAQWDHVVCWIGRRASCIAQVLFFAQGHTIEIVKWKATNEHRIQYYSTCPCINFRSLIKAIFVQELRRCIIQWTTRFGQQAACTYLGWKSKVNDFHVHVSIQKNVLWFQITVCNVAIVAICNSINNLLE